MNWRLVVGGGPKCQTATGLFYRKGGGGEPRPELRDPIRVNSVAASPQISEG
jgi:hypothetical protein